MPFIKCIILLGMSSFTLAGRDVVWHLAHIERTAPVPCGHARMIAIKATVGSIISSKRPLVECSCEKQKFGWNTRNSVGAKSPRLHSGNHSLQCWSTYVIVRVLLHQKDRIIA